MSENAAEKKPEGGWLKSWPSTVAVLIIGFFLGKLIMEKQEGPKLRALEQFQRDMAAIRDMPVHRQFSELLEAVDRANRACPELADWLRKQNAGKDSQELADLLDGVKNDEKLSSPEFREQAADFFRRGALGANASSTPSNRARAPSQ